jgi:hypothetical protein
MDYYTNLEYPTSEISLPNVPNSTTSSVEQKSIPTTSTKTKQFVILTSLSGVIGILVIISFILSILSFLRQPEQIFTTEQISNLDTISANVSIVNTNLRAAGFQDSENVFSAVTDVLKCNVATISNSVSNTLTTNDLVTTIFVAPILQTNEVKTSAIQLNAAQATSTFDQTSIIYSNISSSDTNTLTANSILLENKSTEESTLITPNNVTFHLNSGKIKNLESLRYQALQLSQSTVFTPGIPTLLLPTSNGLQFGNLTLPLADLKIGSTFRIIAYGTYFIQTPPGNEVHLIIANTENKINNQPTQVIINSFPQGLTFDNAASGSWIYTTTFSINNIDNPAATSFQAFGRMIGKTSGQINQVVVNNMSSNINIQQGLQLSFWANWVGSAGAQLTLKKFYLEQLF